ncbi:MULTISPECIES: two-component system histidine kinase PnpS [Paenibacillus]|uniref:two-component system histidine kinase PnpS n=1 Tax=Paenibacillus TaxID=44249 RepID=UPI001F265E31|nr:ATP-binding protein [Paenibacillus sp. JJ-223]CAH1226083.1 Alkaline phosphatase synthesis sensor protein PhoR [Paenibacillus sp. JJ-223]
MRTFRNRLSIIMMALIGVSVIVAGITMGRVFKTTHIEVLEQTMIREINLLKATFPFHDATDPSSLATQKYYSERASELERLTDSRVTFINKDGVVIGDSESDPGTMDNHLNREEIKGAAETGYGRSIRYSETLGEDMLYVALPVNSAQSDMIEMPNGKFDGFIRLSMSLEAVNQGLQRGWIIMFIALGVLFVVVALVSYRVARGLTSPIEHITKVAHRISKLDYDARVKVTRRDEIGQLGLAINGMADSLQTQLKTIRDNEALLQSVLANMTGGIIMIDAGQSIALVNREAERMLGIQAARVTGKPYTELKRHYELTHTIEESVELRERMSEEVSIYNPEQHLLRIDGVTMSENDGGYRGMLFLLQDVTAIRRLEKMRSEFVANVSHELKTPVAAVKGFAETLLSGGVQDKETERSFLQIIYDEGDRLNRLIGDILELSKIESKRAPLECSPVHVHSFLEMVLETLSKVAEKKQIRLQMIVPEELYIEADEDKMKQIFINLLSNGINYTPEGGRVKVQVTVENDGEREEVVFAVSDTGIGIPKKDLPRIFERFYRVDKGRSRNSGGTGLGLSIVKHLVELHHGKLSVESELGMGSTFRVILPLIQEETV